jgi:predicted ester cyclase
MSAAQETSNKASARRLVEAVNSGDAALISKTIDELVEPDALFRTPLPIEATGAQLAKEVFARLIRAYPDLHITIEDLIEEGDEVIARFANGQIAETWAIVDVLSQMRQLGVIPAESRPNR